MLLWEFSRLYMKGVFIVINLIESMKKIKGNIYVGNNNFKEFKYTLYKPVNENKLKELNMDFDKELTDFWKITNGLMFFDSADYRIFSIEETIEYTNDCIKFGKLIRGVYVIAYMCEFIILIDSRKPQKNIYVCDHICIDEAINLNCNFKDFLDELIVSNITFFWQREYTNEETKLYSFMREI